jgi:dolichol-phosphate mannosyltransferase
MEAEGVNVDLSVVLPVFNEQDSILDCLGALTKVLDASNLKFEIIAVDDGSTDKTLVALQLYKNSRSELRIISFKKNYGHGEALSRGLQAAHGKLVATMDSDLQHPPKYLTSMIKVLASDSKIDVVQGVRAQGYRENWKKKIFSYLYYRLIKKTIGISVVPNTPDFRMMRRAVVDSINSLPERDKVLRLLLPFLGYKIFYLPYEQSDRKAGESKFSMSKQLNLAMSSIFSFSAKPLRYMSIIGIIASILCLISAIATLFVRLIFRTVPGWTSLVFLMLGLNALLFGLFSILGEYLGRLYELSLKRPTSSYEELH